MIPQIASICKPGLKISPITPIHKFDFRRQPNQGEYSQNIKPKILFQELIDKEISTGLGSKISVRI
jgi:hypothetical protein